MFENIVYYDIRNLLTFATYIIKKYLFNFQRKFIKKSNIIIGFYPKK